MDGFQIAFSQMCLNGLLGSLLWSGASGQHRSSESGPYSVGGKSSQMNEVGSHYFLIFFFK